MSYDWHDYNKQYLAIRIKEIQQILKSYLQNKYNHSNFNENDSLNKINNIQKNNIINQIKDNISFTDDEIKVNEKTDKITPKPNLEKSSKNNNVSEITSDKKERYYEFVPAIEILSKAFNLSEFEKSMVLLSAAVELDSEISALCSKIQNKSTTEENNLTGGYATFALGFAIFPDGHWSALLPTSPLRKFQILKLANLHSSNSKLVSVPVTINEQILHFLLGLAYSEPNLSSIIIQPISKLHTGMDIEKIAKDKALNYYDENVNSILQIFKARIKKKNGVQRGGSNHQSKNYYYNYNPYQNFIPIIIFSDGDEIDGVLLAQEVCKKLGLHLKYLDAEYIPSRNEDLQQFIQSWTRDAILLGIGLFISQKNLLGGGENQNQNQQILQSLRVFIENIPAPIFVYLSQMKDNLLLFTGRPYTVVNLKRLSKTEQIHVWNIFLETLFKIYKIVDDTAKAQIIKKLINQFDFSSSEISRVCKRAFDENLYHKEKKSSSLFETLWDNCLQVSKPDIGNLGILIAPQLSSSSSTVSSRHLSLDDIVLLSHEKELLRTILIHSQYRDKVYREWGFEEKNRNQGLGITVLFAGPSGTGKTMAAEILSSELRLNMLKVDLSQVVSKYIGETEKNLDKIFESADKGGAVLFFDEADALFGKRTEVKDSHDRYANIETSFLLQRMESYHGLAILSTNMLKALDNAFLRRIRFIVNFPFPDEASRYEIWKKTFPTNTPLESLDFGSLAKLKISGGNIRNICLNASFFAAHDDLPVNKTHIKKALQIEYLKIGQTLTNTDLFI